MALIKIIRVSPTSVVFQPDPAELDSGSDFAVWANLDPDAEHQPTALGQPPNWWMDNALPRFVDGQPAATSPAINLNGAVNTTIQYQDTYQDSDGLPKTITGKIKFVNTLLA